MFKINYKKNLSVLITLPYVTLVILSFLIASSIVYFGSKNSIYQLIDKLSFESSQRIKSNLTNFFQTPHIINKINTDAFLQGEIDSKTLFEKPEKFFFKEHFQFSNISDIYFGKVDGSICGIDSDDGKYILKLTTDFPNRNFYNLNQDGLREEIIKTNTYDSSTRDWFKNAVTKNSPIWSNIYVLKNKNQLGITAARPTYNQDGKLEGVMGVNLTLNSIAEFLHEIKISPNSILYIVEKNGNLVASSTNEPLFKEIDKSKEPQRVEAKNAKNQLISGTIAYSNFEENLNEIKKVKIESDEYIIKTFNFKDPYGLDYIIVMVINEFDFMAEVYSIVKYSIIFGLVILLFIVILSIFIAKKITKPITALSHQTKIIASGEMEKKVVIDSSVHEIEILVNSFNSMSNQLKESFENLEEKVKNRTKELETANNELELSQKILHQAHKNIRDSITYGSMIQHTILPDKELFKEHFEDYFLIWKPKDTVGGDIYLFEQLRNEKEAILFVIDCTGHGVPGAFVTMLVKAIERQIISMMDSSNEVISPSKILSAFNQNMKHLLKQEDKDSISNAGFDGGILYYNKKENIIKYAGANTPLFYIENDQLKIIKADRHSVGYKKSDANYIFNETIIKTQKNMQFYITTDGYLDQNGGKKGFPLGKKRFENIILENYNLSFNEQEKILLKELINYQKDEDRNDDITIVGIKI